MTDTRTTMLVTVNTTRNIQSNSEEVRRYPLVQNLRIPIMPCFSRGACWYLEVSGVDTDLWKASSLGWGGKAELELVITVWVVRWMAGFTVETLLRCSNDVASGRKIEFLPFGSVDGVNVVSSSACSCSCSLVYL